LPGTILSLDGRRIIVACGERTCLSIEELQMPDRQRISAAEFINGMKPEVGESLT